MILPTHALVGAVIGKNISNPWIIIPVALVSHYILDSIRHGDYVDDRLPMADHSWKVSIDVLAAIIITLGIVYFLQDAKVSSNIILGAIFAVLPDFFTLLGKLFPKSIVFQKTKELNAFAHRYNKIPKYSSERQWNFKNARNDIIISVLAMILLFI